ncbi:MAG: hypothetical protein QGF53_15095 [Alphaproteobacteria bacterium]|jgi:hypothetical protein|nr:hypothetical protein [Alphaproteobacteria bacterium]
MTAVPYHEQHKKHRRRNLALAGALCALVVLFFLITLAKFGGGG